MTPRLDRHSQTDPTPEMLSGVKAGNRIQRDERNVRGIGHAHMFRKDNFLGRDNLTIREWGKVIMGLRGALPNHNPVCRSEFLL